ncbi:MAG: cupin [Acidimicrobiia bacterium]
MSERELGPIGTALLFENDRVRIWEVRLEPGERGAVHRHDLDHVLVQISGDRVAVESEPDSPTPWGPYFEAPIRPGDFSYMSRGGIETAYNVGSEPYREIIVELKD